ncbi:MAG TPA: hypothetical protein VNK43_03650 [Gemmatimonadales bacterium]|nr:hypothetical protein [Gemmatimonadales bacterium]
MGQDLDVSEIHEAITHALEMQPEDTYRATYGFALYPREFDNRLVFGIVTSSAESMVLTRRLLQAFESRMAWIYGRVPAAIEPVGNELEGEDSTLDQPVEELRITTYIGPTQGKRRGAIGLPSFLAPSAMTGPLVILVRGQRPEGWPA